MASQPMPQASGKAGLRRRPALPIAAALLATVAIVVAIVIWQSLPEEHTAAELALQRSQLTLISHQLLPLEHTVQSEALAARATWPSIAAGLPAHPGPRLIQRAAAANATAQALPTPAFVGIRHELIGPGERIATSFDDFELLTRRSWAHVDQALAALQRGPASVANFERANAGLYVNSLYDAHFEASLIGEHILNTYRRLGGPQAFGSSLTRAQVHSIYVTFSPQNLRLTPHLWKQLLAERPGVG
jgi:hypothetical protein